MSLSYAYLEDFIGKQRQSRREGAEDAEPVETLLARARGKARAEGVAEGMASAEAREAAEQTDLLRALQEAFDDGALAARNKDELFRDRLIQTLATVLRAVAPDLQQSRAETAVSDALEDLQNASPEALVQIYVATGQVSRMAAITAGLKRNTDILEDAALSPGQVRVHWQSGFDQIDTSTLVEHAITALRTEFERSPPISQAASENRE
ncbi:MAG: hypothetical protein AAGH74_00230 [Pseudomonadota bacterium]